MRRDVQEIFRTTPHEKQVMMFSATLSKEIRPVCKKFMQDVNMLATPPSSVSASGTATGAACYGDSDANGLHFRNHSFGRALNPWMRTNTLCVAAG